MFSYTVIKENFVSAEVGAYTSYGIAAFENGRHILSISDMSLKRELVEKLVGLCNDLQLDPIHLYDAVEDALL